MRYIYRLETEMGLEFGTCGNIHIYMPSMKLLLIGCLISSPPHYRKDMIFDIIDKRSACLPSKGLSRVAGWGHLPSLKNVI